MSDPELPLRRVCLKRTILLCYKRGIVQCFQLTSQCDMKASSGSGDPFSQKAGASRKFFPTTNYI